MGNYVREVMQLYDKLNILTITFGNRSSLLSCGCRHLSGRTERARRPSAGAREWVRVK